MTVLVVTTTRFGIRVSDVESEFEYRSVAAHSGEPSNGGSCKKEKKQHCLLQVAWQTVKVVWLPCPHPDFARRRRCGRCYESASREVKRMMVSPPAALATVAAVVASVSGCVGD